MDRLIIRNGRGRSIDTTSIDLITEKLAIIYIDKVKMARLREYGLLSELRYPVGQYRSRASKHKKTVRCCTTILQRLREGQRSFCTRECKGGNSRAKRMKRTDCASSEGELEGDRSRHRAAFC